MKPAVLEDHVEQACLACLAWLAALGWQVGHGPDVSPPDARTPGTERDTYREVVLKHRLRNAIRRLNPHIPAGAQDEACRMVLTPNVQKLPDGHACRILQVRLEWPLENEAQWPTCFAWLEAAALSMSTVFRPRVRELS